MARVEHDLTASSGPRSRRRGADAPTAARATAAAARLRAADLAGGRYTLDNVVPACGSCNASKCNDEVTGWLRRKRLDERAFLLRHREIRAALALRFPAGPDTRTGAPGGDISSTRRASVRRVFFGRRRVCPRR